MPVFSQRSEVGDAMPEFACQYTLAHFRRADEATIHTDVEAARREGLRDPVATGPQVAALIFRQLRTCFGKGWIEGGECSLTFRRPVYVTDFCVARGRVTRYEKAPEGVRLHCDVWIENQDGDKVIVGTASGLIAS